MQGKKINYYPVSKYRILFIFVRGDRAKCKYCTSEYSTRNVTRLKSHLITNHRDVAVTNGFIENSESITNFCSINNVFEESLVNYVIKEKISFNSLKRGNLQNLLDNYN